MIITLTPNPSLDLLFRADRLVWDDANRLAAPRRRPGGQGINVVRAARALDPAVEALAVAPLGGVVGAELRAALAAESTPVRAVDVPIETRLFVGVREAGTGRSLLLNPRGAALDDEAAAGILRALGSALDDAPPGSWLACCGSLPPALPADFHARAGAAARDRGHRFVPDTDGEALRLAVAAGCDLLVPNAHEAARLVGHRADDVPAAAAAARQLVARGPAAGRAPARGPALAAVTLGERGAVLAAGDGAWHAVVHAEDGLRARLAVGSAVGAGDAFLAALLLALDSGLEPPACLRRAVAAGTATLLSEGADLLAARDVEEVLGLVRVEPVER